LRRVRIGFRARSIPRLRTQLSHQGHAFGERKIKNLQPHVPLELIDKAFDPFLIGAFGSIDVGDPVARGIVQQNDSIGMKQAFEGLIIEPHLLLGVIAVNEHHSRAIEAMIGRRLDELLCGHEIMFDVGDIEIGKVRANGLRVFPEIIDQRRIDENDPTALQVVIQGLAAANIAELPGLLAGRRDV
jgi:hypothetical protein